MTIRDAIRELSKDTNRNGVKLYICEVDSVNEDARTCDVTTVSGESQLKIANVPLTAESNDGFIQLPSIGSTVLVGYSLETGYHVLAFSDVDTIISNQPEFIFNGGDNGGLTITPVLRNELNKLKARMTALEASVAAYASAQAGVAGGVPVFAPLIPALSALGGAVGALPPNGTFSTNIENNEVKH